jgi:hypothetical protein
MRRPAVEIAKALTLTQMRHLKPRLAIAFGDLGAP